MTAAASQGRAAEPRGHMRATRLGIPQLLLGVILLAVVGAGGGAARAQTAYLVTDLTPGEGGVAGSKPADLMPAGNHLFFIGRLPAAWSRGTVGYFWFSDAGNVETVLKVIDGRGLNGRFWVFYGALSDVHYTLTVTDTVTGVEKTYTNPAGQFASVADTAAF
jgi:hypothetical protein